MATVVTKTVKTSGGDYTTLALAEAQNLNLVSLDQQMDIICDNFEDTSTVNFNGWTTDATRFIRVLAANPHGSVGGITANSYRMKSGGPVLLQAIGVNGLIIFEGIQFWNTGGGQACVTPFTNGQLGAKVRFLNCVFYTGPASSGYGALVQSTNQPWVVEFINCTFVCGFPCVQRTNGDVYFYGCTFITTVASQHSVNLGTANGTKVVKSCYSRCIGGGGTLAYSGVGDATIESALSNDASGTVDNVLYNTSNFTSVTADAENLTLPEDSALIGVGADRSAEAAPFNYTTDIRGFVRPLTLDDVGAFQTEAAIPTLWLIELLDFEGVARVGDVKKMIVEADSAEIAELLASSRFEGDSDWAGASAVTTDLSTILPEDLAGFRYEVKVGPSTPGLPDEVVVSHTATDQTVDQVGTALAVALNAHALIAGAGYDTGTNVLTVANAGDALGDRTLVVNVFPSGHTRPLPAMVSTFVHQGAEAAALSCVLVVPDSLPKVIVIG